MKAMFQSDKIGVNKRMIYILFLLSLFFQHTLAFAPVSSAASAAPVTPSASAEAKAVLSYLYEISGQKIITGQHDYLESADEWNDSIRKMTGQYAGIHGYELGAIMNQSKKTISEQRQGVVNSAINWHKSGGLVSITYHASIPGTCACWSNVQTQMSQERFDRIVKPGTEEYEHLIADLDDVAAYLKQLQQAGVPVLWRPYHEMNGGWFWWGKKHNFASLWNIMYDRFVNVHHLNNLLWVWSPNAPNAWADSFASTFPGGDKVDILAVDVYDNDYKQRYYDDIVKLANGKPVAIGESGQIPDSATLEKQPKWVYMMSWGQMLTGKNSEQAIRSFYADPRSVNRDSLADRLDKEREERHDDQKSG